MKKLIGDTPMIKIKYRYHGEEKEIYCKLEQYNLTGSIKDRIAEYILLKSKELGILKPHMPIIEATSGNTGISFAALGARYQHPVTIFMPDWVSTERKELMKSYGAEVVLVSKEEGGFETCIQRADELSQKIDGFRPNQFSNVQNMMAHYETTGKEIVGQISVSVGAFTSGIGTGGTLMGIGKRLKEVYPFVKLIALEPSELPILSGGHDFCSHKIEGIGDEFIPEIVDISMIDDIIQIHDHDAIVMASMLARDLGLGVGISSGANFLSAVRSNHDIDGVMVTVFPDDQKKYLSTDLMRVESLEHSTDVDEILLISYEVL